MAINFPDTPLTNDVFTVNGRRYVYDGFKWIGGTPTTQVTISSDTAPTTPVINDLWWNTTEGALYVYYNDGNTSQWVSAAPPGINGTNSVISVNSPLTYDSINKIIGMNGTPIMNGGTSVVGIGGLANSTSQFAITDTLLAASGSLNGNALNIFQKWSTTGNPTALLLNANNVSSGSTAKLIDLQVDGVTKFNVDKTGICNFERFILGPAGSTAGMTAYAGSDISISATAVNMPKIIKASFDGYYSWTPATNYNNTPDLALYRDTTGTLAQRNGVFTQTQRWYNTFTDQSNFERVSVSFNKPTTAVFTGSVSNGVIGITGTILNVTAITSGVIATGMVLNPGATGTISGYIPSATFTGTIANNTTLTTSSANGTITVGQIISGSGVTAGTIILSGSGSNWNITSSGNVTSVAMTATGGTGATGTYTLNTSQIVPAGNTITGTRYSDIPYAVIATESSGTGAPNMGIALSPKGTGAITAQIPDGTVAGGNARGQYSVDLQTSRSANDQVASGNNSVILGGGSCVASGASSVAIGQVARAIGQSSIAIGYGTGASGIRAVAIGGGTSQDSLLASGNYSVVLGGYNNIASSQMSMAFGEFAISNKFGQVATGITSFSASADCQYSYLGFAGATTTATTTEIFLKNSSPNRATIPNSTTWAADIDIVARSAGGVDNAYLKRKLLIKRGLLAANTVIVAGPDVVGTDMFSANAADWSVSFTADTTNGSLNVYVTGSAATNIRWVVKASLVEVGYI